jgi:hypothetical protein
MCEHNVVLCTIDVCEALAECPSLPHSYIFLSISVKEMDRYVYGVQNNGMEEITDLCLVYRLCVKDSSEFLCM